MKKRVFATLLTMMTIMVTGCGKVVVDDPQPEDDLRDGTIAIETPVDPKENNGETPGGLTFPEEVQEEALYKLVDGVAVADSMESFLAAIEAEEKEIALQPGTYSLSDYLDRVWEKEGEDFNLKHNHLSISECYDGLELTISDVHEMTIRANENVFTEITTDPRYATVLTFVNSSAITLKGLTIGHTDKGYCVGDVVSLLNVDGALLTGMDLYGCGVNGINIAEGSNHVTVEDSTIHDCSNVAVVIKRTSGIFIFSNCEMKDSDGGLVYADTNGYAPFVYFKDCSFGQQESNDVYFDNAVMFSNCDIMEFSGEYPDYYGDLESLSAFTLDKLTALAFDEHLLYDTHWTGIYSKDWGEEELQGLPLDYYDSNWSETNAISLYLWEDGTGIFAEGSYYEEVTWKMESEYAATLYLGDIEVLMSVNYIHDEDSEDSEECRLWLTLPFDGTTVYMSNL